jgi:fengycin family lipopeptide synthetase B
MILEDKVFKIVAEAVGMEVDELDLEMDLEADLAMDSLRMMALLNKLSPLIPDIQKSANRLSPEVLGNIRNLGQLSDFMASLNSDIAGNSSTKPVSGPDSTADVVQKPVPAGQKIPILNSQYLFLMGYYLIQSNSLCSALRIRGSYDRTALKQSYGRLIKRHVNLGSVFHVPVGANSFKDYQYILLENPGTPDIKEKDVRHLDTLAREAALDETFNSILNYDWQLEQWPMHGIVVMHLSDSEFQVFWGNDHLVSDGMGNQRLLHELMELYQAELEDVRPDLPEAPDVNTYIDTARQINAYHSAEEESHLRAYVASQPKGLYFWNPQEAKITHDIPQFRNVPFVVDAETTKGLKQKARELKLPMNTLVTGAFLRAACQMDSSPNPVLQIPTSGTVYPDVDATEYVGCFAGNLALSFSRPIEGETWESYLLKIHKEIQKAIAWGYDRTQTLQMATMVRDGIELNNGALSPDTLSMMRKAGSKSNLYIPYTGEGMIRESYGPLEVLDYRAGGINVLGTLDVLHELFREKMYTWASFDAGFFNESTVHELMANYHNQLNDLAGVKDKLGDTHGKGVESVPVITADSSCFENLVDAVFGIVEKIVHRRLHKDSLDSDLESEIGMDSLARIRIIAKVSSLSTGKVDRDALFNCRTLREMVQVIDRSYPSCAVSSGQEKPEVVVQSVNDAKNTAGVGTGRSDENYNVDNDLDPTLGEIPYLHILRQCEVNSDLIAVEKGDRQITYSELDQQSSKVANFLKDQGIGRADLVGVMTLRGPDMWIAILGIMKTGAAYVPVDPDYPSQRIQYILDHAACKVLITENTLAAKLTESLTESLSIECLLFLDDWAPIIPVSIQEGWNQVSRTAWGKQSAQRPEIIATPDDLMVVLYTSGSTGKPKGVALNHRGYMNRLRWHQKTFQIHPGDRVAQKTSCCFDISVWELFWPLMMGATMCSLEKSVVCNPWKLATWMKESKINVMHFVPPMFGEFLHALEDENLTFPDLRWLIFSGEALPVSFMRQWIDKYGTYTGLANLYGPTEASIDVTCHIVDQRPDESVERVPIGKPVDNTYILIIDKDHKLLPPGEMGELCIGGIQLALGYLKDEEKTAEAFIKNPFDHVPGENIYRTGDLAVELPDGSFDYRGRMDSQVKIRGFRIELGEIESVINEFPGMQQAVVLAVDFDGDKRLVAWMMGTERNTDDLKATISKRLADYMIPHFFFWMDDLPKNHNGKLDRKALIAMLKNGELNEGVASTSSTPSIEQKDRAYPPGPAQRWLLSYFDEPYQWTGYNRFRFKKALDIDVFTQALQVLAKRHAAVRSVFFRQNGEWKQTFVNNVINNSPELLDGMHLSDEQLDEEVRRLILQVSESLKIDSLPLWRVLVVRVAYDIYDISMVGHHIMGDMVSNQILFADTWKIYSEILNGGEPSTAPVKGYDEYLEQLEAMDRRGLFDTHVDYWMTRIPRKDCAFQFPRDFESGENLECDAHMESFTLDAAESRRLMRESKQYYESNLYSLLLGPMYKTLADWTGRSFVIVSQRMSGRDLGNGNNFYESVGNYAVNYPLAIMVEASNSWRDLLRKIKDGLSTIPMNGVTYDWISERLPDYMYPDTRLTPIRVNYIGNFDTPKSDLFEWNEADKDRRLAPAKQQLSTYIEVHFMVVKGQIKMNLTFSKSLFKQATMKKFGQCYLKQLRALIGEIPADKAQSLQTLSV